MGRKNSFTLDICSVRLVKDAQVVSDKEIHSPEDAIHIVGEILSDMDREMVCVINLRSDGVPINFSIASIGALSYSMAHPRELLKASILSNAANIILLHNHPSTKLIPSKEDIQLTDRLLKVCELVGIPLLDHIIVGGDNRNYFSFRERGIVRNTRLTYASDYHELQWNKGAFVAEKGRDKR